jgi:hypothetical protein
MIEAHGIDIIRLICPCSVVLSREAPVKVMCVVEHMGERGKLMDLVQDIYMEDEQLGTKLAWVC